MLSQANAAIAAAAANDSSLSSSSSSSSSSLLSFDNIQQYLTDQYRKLVIELAGQSNYIISVQDPTCCVKIPDPADYRNNRITVYNEWEEKEYKRHKITKQDFERSRELLREYGEIDTLSLEENSGCGYIILEKEIEVYKYLAQCYLKMSSEEFDRADWGYTKIVLDACHFRTVHSLADISQKIYAYFHFGKVSDISEDEYECLRMYRLWTGKAKTKPWEINGGIVYEEDLNAIMKMEELDASGKNLKAKKEQAMAGGGKVGEDGEVHKHTTRFKNR